ncbi:MAG: Zn-ribbon domain-containing OB-fold protein [Candidatus Kariarchaeaceae archaeon]|jgi:uncharacterized OB-fold protein
MLPTQRDNHGAPTREIYGDFPVTFHYTAGIAGEKFLYGLKDQKFLATYCGDCDFTYFPAKMFCEDCFKEFDESDWKELELSGELFSFTKVYQGHDGSKLDEPYFIGLVKVSGSSTTFFHRLVDIADPKIGMAVKPVWATDRKANIMDLKGFTS